MPRTGLNLRRCYATWRHCVTSTGARAPRANRGHEQRGTRFAVVVQSDSLPLSTLLVAPTSTSARAASFRPRILPTESLPACWRSRQRPSTPHGSATRSGSSASMNFDRLTQRCESSWSCSNPAVHRGWVRPRRRPTPEHACGELIRMCPYARDQAHRRGGRDGGLGTS